MGYKIGFSIGYGIVFLAYEAILFLLTGFALPGAWLSLVCTVLVLGVCLAAVWKDAFRAGIAHLPMALGAVLTIFFVLQLVAVCLICGGGTVMGGKMIAERERDNRAKRAAHSGEEEA